MKAFNKASAMAASALTALSLTFTAAAPAPASAQNWGGIISDVLREQDRNRAHDQRQDRQIRQLQRGQRYTAPRHHQPRRGGRDNDVGRDIAIGVGTAIIGGIIANGINGGGARGGQVVTQRGSGGLYIETPCDKAATALNNAINNAEYDGFVSVQEGKSVISKERTAERQCGPINIPSHYDAYRR